MTGREWAESTEPLAMLRGLPKPSASDRKLILFGVACCRSIWHLLIDERSRTAVTTAEDMVDGRSSEEQVTAARGHSHEARMAGLFDSAAEAAHRLLIPGLNWYFNGAADLSLQIRCAEDENEGGVDRYVLKESPGYSPAHPGQADLVRDIFGNPFRPLAFDPAWRTDTAVSLARGMYGSRDFSAMPILADALQDAGCDNPDVLSHCRDEQQPHVRGCWVVDLVLVEV